MTATQVLPILVVMLLLKTVLAAGGVLAAEPVTWSDIAPIVNDKCVLCHAGTAAPLGLRLDSHAGALAGSQNGPIASADTPAEESELIRRLRGEALPRMPMTGPPFLSEEQIGLFVQWIEAGMLDGDSPNGPAEPAPEVVRDADDVTYERVAPIFARRCVKCHTDSGLMGVAPEGYKLDSYEATLAFADRARVVPFNPDASELARKIRGQSLPRMPFDGPPFLDEAEISLIEKWIEQGAKNSLGATAPIPVGAKVRLRGRLGSRSTLDGLAFDTAGGMRLDKDVRPGSMVELRGHVNDEGGVTATRIKD